MTNRYQTWKPFAYGELEACAGITDRLAFWREHRTEAAARVEIHARIERRIAAGEFSPLWPHAASFEQPTKRRRVTVRCAPASQDVAVATERLAE